MTYTEPQVPYMSLAYCTETTISCTTLMRSLPDEDVLSLMDGTASPLYGDLMEAFARFTGKPWRGNPWAGAGERDSGWTNPLWVAGEAISIAYIRGLIGEAEMDHRNEEAGL